MNATDHDLIGLRRDGVFRLDGLAPALDVLTFLNGKRKYDGHIQGQPSRTQACWSMTDVISAPGVLETALAWTPLAGAYLESDPLLYSVNAFTMYPSAGPTSPDTQEFHRDKDDHRFLALFVYLTDVLTPEAGAHQFQRGTHKGFNTGTVETVTGPAGTMFFSDGRGLHRGIRPTSSPRTILWIRWGVTDPPASYQWCGLKPIDKSLVGDRYPTDAVLQRQIRLVLA